MTPKRTRIQSLIPYALPASLAALACLFVWNGGDEQRDKEVRVVSSPSEVSPKVPMIRSSEIPDTVGISASQLMMEKAPSDIRVAALIQGYQTGDRSVAATDIETLLATQKSKRVSFTLAGMELSGMVESRKEEASVVSMGIRLDDELGMFTLTMRPGQRVYSTLFFQDELHAFTFHGYPENGRWQVALKSVDSILCAPLGSAYPPERNAVGMPKANVRDKSTLIRKVVAAPPDLESDPGSSFVIYIDLDGEVIDQPEWTQFNGGQTITALPHPRADDVDFVTRVWDRVCEDFAPFDINVTTSRTVFDSAAPTRRMMCIGTPTDDAMPGSGGVAFLDSFGSGLVCWSFNLDEGTLADTISHEVGHTLGLSHDGKINVFEYYGGHGTGEVSWAPIMGAYFADFEPPFIEEELTQWSKGEYPDATNQEDDLQMIISRNGFFYRDDDYGNNLRTASILSIVDDNVTLSGVIEQSTDDDWFTFATSGGTVDLNADTTSILSPDQATRGSNLALSLTLYDSDGKVILEDNPEETQGASISQSLQAGNYFVKISGEGRRDLETGFTEYASLGRYYLTGTIPQTGLIQIDPPLSNLPRAGGASFFRVITDRSWTWSTDAPWVDSVSPNDRTGNGEVRYRVTRNPNREAREARIVISTKGYETYHVVRQAGSDSDDHGDTRPDATIVTQVSSTPGELEEALDVDMFLVEVQGFGDLTVRTTGKTDTYAEFFDISGARLASDDNSARPNFTITQRVSTGSYYVGVRHSVQGGVGKYTLECSFKNRPALIIDPPNRKVGPSGGRFLINVISNTEWTWSSDVPWITSPASRTQDRGQGLAYTVNSYNGGETRKGHITFRNKGNRVTHTITQRPANDDDHSDKRSTATVLEPNGRDKGIIQFEGDSDMFSIRLGTSGTLDLETTGNTDTVAELLNEEGKTLLTVDDGLGDNFQIVKALPAGKFFLRITAFGGVQVGPYALRSKFTPSKLVDVVYTAEKGGKIRGDTEQSVPLGQDARSVTAVPNRGYTFVRWSDGVRNPRRSDLNLLSHVQVSAKFVGTVEVSTRRGKLTHKQMPPVDFGTIDIGKSRSMEFTVTNQSSDPLTNFRVESTGFAARNWRVSKPSRGTIQPGQKATFRVTLRGQAPGFYNNEWAIRANGMNKAFIVRTMGIVAGSEVAGFLADDSTASSGPTSAIPSATQTMKLPWIDVSPDGYFRYRFERAEGDSSEQLFWISPDGVRWEEALVLDVWKTHATQGITHFEAVFAPPLVPAPRILVNESSP